MGEEIMQREVIRWLQSLDLTYQVRYPQQDLSNGFTLAEIASRHDRRVAMHSYVPGCSSECKRRNWKALLRDLQRIGCAVVTTEMAEATMQGKPGAALAVLEKFYVFFCGRSLPRQLTGNNTDTTVMFLNKLDFTHASKNSPSGSEIHPKNTQPTEREHDEVAFAQELRKPGFARPTAATLLHLANRDTRNVQLDAAISGDELRIQMRNEKLLSKHKIINKAYRHAEPERFAPVKQQRHTQITRGSSKGLTGRKGPCRDNRATVDSVSVVNVNTVNKRLMGAVRLQNDICDTEEVENADELHDRGARELLEACGNNLRLGLSKILCSALESHGLNKVLEGLSGEDSAIDVLSAFVGRREELPFDTVAACWSALQGASGGIASALLARPTEYMYLLRALHFVFAPEVVHVRMLHVSGFFERRTPQRESSEMTSTAMDEDSSAQYGMALRDDLPSVTVNSEEPQQVIFSNERAYNVASAFCLLCGIGEALHAASPSVSRLILTKYFLPAASQLFCSASAAILEALARVFVTHVCGGFSQRRVSEFDTSLDQTSGSQQQQELSEMQEGENALRHLTLLLTGPLKEIFFQTESADVSNSVQRRCQYNLFMYHVLRHVRNVLGVVDCQHERQKDCAMALHLAASSTASTTTSVCTPSTPVELCFGTVFMSLGSSSMHERSIGLAMLVQFLAWDRWDLVIDPLFLVVNDVKQRGTSSGFLQRAAEAWEIRVLLLELLTVSFRKALSLLDENSGGRSVSVTKTRDVSISETADTTVVSLIRQKFDFHAVEEVTVMCLLVSLEAPLLQRQLALQIVGACLLPEEQRKAAVVWLRGLFAFPVDELNFLLCSREMGRCDMHDSTPSTRRKAHEAPSSPRRTPIREKDEKEKVGRKQSTTPRRAQRGDGADGGATSSVRLLLGRVEPAYVVAPLNQSWDVFGVVQTALMFEEVLTTTQVFSLVLAALLGPQAYDVPRAQFALRRSQAATRRAVCASIAANKSSVFCRPACLGDDDTEASRETTSGASLGDVVETCGHTDISNDQTKSATETNKNDTMIFNSSMAFTENENKEQEENYTGTIVPVIDLEEGSKGEADEVDETVFDEESFWLSVLRLLRAQLNECLTIDKRVQQRDRKQSLPTTTESGGFTPSVCRIAEAEDPARLRELAATVLLTLYNRYGATSSEMSLQGDVLKRARQWLANM